MLQASVTLALGAAASVSQGQMDAHLDVMVEMSDGVSLGTDVHLPDGAGPFPVILTRSHGVTLNGVTTGTAKTTIRWGNKNLKPARPRKVAFIRV